MSVLTNIVAANEDEIAAVGESLHPVDTWSGLERRRIDTAKIVTLHCLLSNDQFSEALYSYEPVYVSTEGVVVLRLADEIVVKLAELEDESMELVAEELAATEEFEQENWPVEEILDLVQELVELARLSESQGQSLLVWMHPLQT